MPPGNALTGPSTARAYGLRAAVFDDAAADVMTGSSGQDWFWANIDAGVKDRITDLGASEFATDLDFILS